MICVSMGYPTVEEEMEIMRMSQEADRTAGIIPVLDAPGLADMIQEARGVYMHERICRLYRRAGKATRENEWTELGLSPRGTVALTAMAKAYAYLKNRVYVVPSDVEEVFPCVGGAQDHSEYESKSGTCES